MTSSNIKIYFVSDAHLGFPNHPESLIREKLLVKWLNTVSNDATSIYLLGDIFDFWFEYKRVVPRGYTRLLGKLSELCDKGIPIHFFTGNHDMWTYDYLSNEVGLIIHKDKEVLIINNKVFFIAHGDGLGPDDKSYKILKKIFRNKFAQWLFSKLHPNFAIKIATKWSHHNRYNENPQNLIYKGKNGERLIQYAYRKLNDEHYDYFIFGHRHIPMMIKLNEKSLLVNLGDWINNFTYAVFDGNNLTLKSFLDDKQSNIYIEM
jgi:UDP-2,3-diacylglucosamine hydrolase